MAASIDETLIALADPVRRGIVELLKIQPRRAGELATLLDLNGPAMSKHLKVLRDNRLIEEERHGRGRSRARLSVCARTSRTNCRIGSATSARSGGTSSTSFKAAAEAASNRATPNNPGRPAPDA